MNCSLNLLISNNLALSPFISQISELKMSKSFFSRSFGHFVYNTKSVSLFDSCFSHFLNSVLKHDAKTVLISGLITKHLQIPGFGSDIVVKNAQFLDCSSAIDGGVIDHFSPDSGSLDVSHSTFYSCYCRSPPGDGGAIYFSGKSSLVYCCCATKCRAFRDGHFLCASIRGKTNNPNHLNFSTVVYCGIDRQIGWQTNYLCFGDIFISRLNTSFCSTIMQASSFMMHSLNQNAIADYTTSYNNTGPWTVYFFAGRVSEVKRSNFLFNYATSKTAGVIYYYQNSKLSNCRFANNQIHILMPKSTDGNILVTNCIFDQKVHDPPGLTMISCETKQKIVKILKIVQFQTQLCENAFEQATNVQII